jgi:hypothetical protein
MSDYEKLMYARSRLGLARMMSDTAEIGNWTEHVRYWESRLTSLQADRVSSEQSDGEGTSHAAA